MNQKIKEILEKHIDIDQLLPDFYHEDLNNAIIEILSDFYKWVDENDIYKRSTTRNVDITEFLNSKNIAQ